MERFSTTNVAILITTIAPLLSHILGFASHSLRANELLPLPCTNNLLDARRSDVWKHLVQGTLLRNIHYVSGNPKAEYRHQLHQHRLGKELIHKCVGWQLRDLTTLQLFNRVICDIKFAP
jgi:hypothetical protein